MYQRLASSEAAHDEYNKNNFAEENDSKTHIKHSPRSSLHLSALVCLICTVANVLVGVGIRQYSSHSLTTPEVTHADMRNLRRPSQFIGFDSIARPSPPFPRSFDTFPITLAQVDRDEPARVFEDYMRKYMTRARTINPEDHRVLVDSSVSPCFHVSLRSNLAHLDSRSPRNSRLPTSPALFLPPQLVHRARPCDPLLSHTFFPATQDRGYPLRMWVKFDVEQSIWL